MKRLLLVTLISVAWGSGAHAQQQGPAKPTELPRQPPPPPVLEFTGPEEGWPPRVKGASDFRLLPLQEIPTARNEKAEAQLRTAALANPRVRELLGERFAFVSAGEVEPKKGADSRPAGSPVVRLTFFSHAHNTAVEVLMSGSRVQSAERRPGEAPPEGAEEIRAAIALAERDSRLAGTLEGLSGNALVAFPEKGQPGYGHRVLDVTFTREGVDLARSFALVDLTDEKVLAAGPIEARGRRQP